MAVTLKDIAKATQTSISTVSKVLTGHKELSRISPQTIAAIRTAAQNLRYTPNANARAMAGGSAMALGVCFGPEPSPLSCAAQLLEGISSQLSETNYDLILDSDIPKSFRRLEQKRVDGLLCLNTESHPQFPSLAKEFSGHLVMFNYCPDPDLPLCSVNVDDCAGIEMTVDYLLSLGHKDIAFIAEQCEHPSNFSRHRTSAFEQITRRRKLSSSPVIQHASTCLNVARTGNCAFMDGYEAAGWILSSISPVTAIICYSDLCAIGAIARLSENNIRVPEELSVIGFGNSIVGEYSPIALTSVSEPLKFMGQQAVELIIQQLKSPNAQFRNRTVLFQPQLCLRSSCNYAPVTH